MEEWEPITVAREYTADTVRVNLVGAWPEVTAITDDALALLDPRFVLEDGGTLRFTLANGSAVYRLDAEATAAESHMGRRIYRRLRGQ